MPPKTKKPVDTKKSSTKKRKNSQKKKTFNSYIVKVLKQIHPDASIGEKEGVPMVNAMLEIIVKKVAFIVSILLRRTGKTTVTSREIQTAVRLILPGEYMKNAVVEATRAVTKYNATQASIRTPEKNKPRVVVDETKRSKSSRAGILFSVSRTSKIFYPYVQGSGIRKGAGAAIYLAAVLQYVAGQILELAGNEAREVGKKSIKPRYLVLAIGNSEELNYIFSRTVIQGGIIPHIHKALLNKGNKAGEGKY